MWLETGIVVRSLWVQARYCKTTIERRVVFGNCGGVYAYRVRVYFHLRIPLFWRFSRQISNESQIQNGLIFCRHLQMACSHRGIATSILGVLANQGTVIILQKDVISRAPQCLLLESISCAFPILKIIFFRWYKGQNLSFGSTQKV